MGVDVVNGQKCTYSFCRMDTKEIHIGTRIPKDLYKRLLRAQKDVKQKTGFQITISEIVRRAIEQKYPPERAA